MIRHSNNASESWRTLPWKKFRRNLFRLQRRMYKAVQGGDYQKARSLQKLILKSTAARLLAVRQVTQLNAGKKTAGIDGKASLSFKERLELSEELKRHASNWYHQKLREIPIPKKDGKTRILKVPTIADRAWQCLAKYALEPAHEATFHARSYGFRTGRSAHDAQKILFQNLNSQGNGIKKRVIELDIEKCFDRISHSAIMDRLIATKGIRQGIFRCLQAGVNPEFPEQGTPQGGERNSKLYNGETSKVLKRQNHTCAACGLKFLSNECIHLHHKDGNHANWKKENLMAIHESCHDYLHMSKTAR